MHSHLFVIAALALTLQALVTGRAVVLQRRRDARPTGVVERADWRLYLNDLPNPCADGHTRLYLTTETGESCGVICSVCTTALPRPDWMDCDDCAWFPTGGRLHVTHCPTHTPAPSTERRFDAA